MLKKEEHLYPVMSPAQFNQAVIPLSPVYIFFLILFQAALHSTFPPGDNCLSVHSGAEEEIQFFTPSSSDFPFNPVVTFISPISSPPKTPFNPASPEKTPASPLQSTCNPTTTIPGAPPPLSTGLQFPTSLPENDQFKSTDELLPFSSLPSDVRLLLLRPNHIKLQPDHSVLGRQHRREYYTNRARRTKRPRFNQHSKDNLKPEFSTWETTFWYSRRQECTIQSTSLPSQ